MANRDFGLSTIAIVQILKPEVWDLSEIAMHMILSTKTAIVRGSYGNYSQKCNLY
jgi:hypothetical protein